MGVRPAKKLVTMVLYLALESTLKWNKQRSKAHESVWVTTFSDNTLTAPSTPSSPTIRGASGQRVANPGSIGGNSSSSGSGGSLVTKTSAEIDTEDMAPIAAAPGLATNSIFSVSFL